MCAGFSLAFGFVATPETVRANVLQGYSLFIDSLVFPCATKESCKTITESLGWSENLCI